MYIADPEHTPSQIIAEALRTEKSIVGYGRTQHGMNGKDADLDAGGQCAIRSVAIIETNTLFIELHIERYANICIPTDDDKNRQDALQENAQFIIEDATAYPGEWTGSDYWCFNMEETLRVPLSLEEYERETRGKNIDRLASRCAKFIRKSKEGRAFERWAAELYHRVNALHKLTNAELGT